MSTYSKMEKVPNYTQVREGDHATVACKMPRYQYEFYIMTPSGDKLMAVKSNKVYILPKYWLRTRMVGVVTSRNTSIYVFRLYNVTLADAGRYTCRREGKGATKISMTRCIHDLFVSRHNATGTKPVMTSPNKSASPAYARLGSTAFLSWTLPRPGLREFTVRRISSKSLFHITDYNQVNVTDRYKSRATFTGRMNSSGSGVFSFQLYNVDWPDNEEYRCHRGSPRSTGSRVYDCGQWLFVIYIAVAYIVAPQTVEADKNVTLTCYVAVKGYIHTLVTWSWRRNEVEHVNIGIHPLAVSKLHGDYFYLKSALIVSDVGQDDDRGRYTCKAELVRWNVQTDWSEEFTMSTDCK
ncbi:uncharacterized protein LOC125375959 [Haliotis rufescens]|uniref:uncharacterized protein LOC125375959 n=1 Tax=Haliotis rufescens TaxID=6454 RepID=UPI00201F6EDE|nr:uncharacterized protein LOC125375959 [Haliotis rufescens]